MPRKPRLTIPGLPHHVIQRGNRSQKTFFEPENFEVYKRYLSEACRNYGVKIANYCLMPNHIHLIVYPGSAKGLSFAMGRGHESYSRYINFKNDWKGLFWQDRFRSFPMDDAHLYQALKYVELNPVRAGLVGEAEDYIWSSARYHLGKADDDFITYCLKGYVESWKDYLGRGICKSTNEDSAAF